MTDFTFKCPACDQPMISEVENAGRQIDCPDCGATITLPHPPKDPDLTPPAILDAETPKEPNDEVAMQPIPLSGSPATETNPEGSNGDTEKSLDNDKVVIPPTPEEPPFVPSSSNADDAEDTSSNLRLAD